MSGHSKWATTKHRKAAQDKKRGALFSKLSRAITTAAKTGGSPDLASNAALATAIAKAKSYSLPKDRIEGAIRKAFGAGEGADFEEVVYEGYAAHGIAVYVEALTDNRNRTAADVRSAFTRCGGNLASTGSVAFQFERKGEIAIDKSAATDEEEVLLVAMDAGAEDIEDDGAVHTLVTDPSEMMSVRDAIEEAGVPAKGAQLVMRPTTTTALGVGDSRQVLRLVDALEDLEDVQEVYHNLEATDELMAALDAE